MIPSRLIHHNCSKKYIVLAWSYYTGIHDSLNRMAFKRMIKQALNTEQISAASILDAINENSKDIVALLDYTASNYSIKGLCTHIRKLNH